MYAGCCAGIQFRLTSPAARLSFLQASGAMNASAADTAVTRNRELICRIDSPRHQL
jgi:hypothetical protein